MSGGWTSRFDIGARTRHRLVLHGNVLDWVLFDGAPCTLVDWIRRRLVSDHGVSRVVYYDCASEPRALEGETEEPRPQTDTSASRAAEPPGPEGEGAGSDAGAPWLEAALARFPGPDSERWFPSRVLPALALLLRDPEHKAAAIVENAEYWFDQPCQETALLHGLARGEGRAPTGIAVHLYSNETAIPRDFVTTDPDTALIPVSVPRFAEREEFFQSLDAAHPLRRVRFQQSAVTPADLARATEGYRLREVIQLRDLAGSSQPPLTDLKELLSVFRFGRKVDYWERVDISDVRRKLHKRVKGQDAAIRQVIAGILRAKHHVVSLIDESVRTPAMVLFFVGATGVGKTLAARTICEAVTGTEENLKRIDMSEYQRDHSDQRLIGSPPGYVGYSEGGQLTTWVQERPYSVVLIDETEKAHERIMDIFIQVLDGARLTDGKGATVDFSETILIFTSNIGTSEDQNVVREDRAAVDKYFRGKVEGHFRDELERKEIFNRLKPGIVVFDYIRESDAREFVVARLREIADGVRRRLGGAVDIQFDPADPGDAEVVGRLLGRAEYRVYGLREVNNVMQELVGNGLARFLDQRPPGQVAHFRWNAAGPDPEVEIVT